MSQCADFAGLFQWGGYITIWGGYIEIWGGYIGMMQVLGYSWSTLLWHWCYYPHRSRDSVSPVCGIFFWFLRILGPPYCGIGATIREIWYLPYAGFFCMKCYQNWNVTKTEMSPETEMSHKTEISQKLKFHLNWNITETKILPKLKFHLKWLVTKTKMSPKLKCHQKKSP